MYTYKHSDYHDQWMEEWDKTHPYEPWWSWILVLLAILIAWWLFTKGI